MPVFRTMLFAPGNHPRKVEKSLGLDADAVILDLEDAVAIAEKPATRAAIVEALAGERRCRAYVRVNAFDTPFCYGDLCEVVGPRLDGVILPKVENAAQLIAIDWLLTQLEHERGMTGGAIDLIPIIETGKGAAAVDDIARAGTRTRRLSFGAGDYTLDMGMRWTLEESELDSVRASVVLASRAARLEPPLDTVFIHLDQPEMLARSASRVRDMGFQGKLCIHPSQTGPVNAAFTPTDEEVAKARRYVQAFEEAEAAGSASIQVDGFFIDYPIVEQARRMLDLVEAIEASQR